MLERRVLVFGRLEEVPDEVDRLLRGHRPLGNWTLAQVVYHVAAVIRVTTLGRGPVVARPPDRAEEVRRRKFFRDGRFPSGVEIPLEILKPPRGLDAGAEADRLRQAIAKFRDFPGPFPAHHILGPMSAQEWERFHQIHCAHHLSHIAPAHPGESSEEVVI